METHDWEVGGGEKDEGEVVAWREKRLRHKVNYCDC